MADHGHGGGHGHSKSGGGGGHGKKHGGEGGTPISGLALLIGGILVIVLLYLFYTGSIVPLGTTEFSY